MTLSDLGQHTTKMTELCEHCDKHTTKLYDSGGKDKICESCFDHYSREKSKDESQEDYETRLPLSYEVLEDLKETAQGSEVRYEVLIRCALNLIRNPDIKNTWTEGDKTIVLLKGNCQNCGDYVEYNEGTEEVCSNCEEY